LTEDCFALRELLERSAQYVHVALWISEIGVDDTLASPCLAAGCLSIDRVANSPHHF
jgi:hypothetical protein